MGNITKMDDPREVTLPRTPSLPRALASALTASEYVVGAGLRWTPRAALALLSDADHDRLAASIESAREAMACDIAWLANRLTVLWLSAGYRKGEAQATAWLGEMIRLLGHVPTDIAATAIDQAVVQSERGFIPAVGEILKLAEPAIERRRLALQRLETMLAASIVEPAVETSDTPPICTPEQAAEALAEFGMRSEAPSSVASRPAAAQEASIEEYIAHGLTEDEARKAMEDRRRMLSRGRPKQIGDIASDVIEKAA